MAIGDFLLQGYKSTKIGAIVFLQKECYMNRDQVVREMMKHFYKEEFWSTPKKMTITVEAYQIQIDKIPRVKMDMEDQYVVGITREWHIISTSKPMQMMGEIANYCADEIMRVEKEIESMLVDGNNEKIE
jgi:hypothetical protein